MALTRVAAIVGAGPGIGSAVAQRFAREGFNIALISRSAEKLNSLATKLQEENKIKAVTLSADASNATDVISVFKRVKEELGKVDVLIYNTAYFKMGPVSATSLEDYELAFKTIALGAISSVKEVLPSMIESKSGTIIFTGATASLRGGVNFSAFASAKFALRAFAQSLAREVHPQGIHVVHAIVDGVVNVPGSSWIDATKAANGEYVEPASVAELYWQAHAQSKNAWTHEIEVRPYTEKF